MCEEFCVLAIEDMKIFAPTVTLYQCTFGVTHVVSWECTFLAKLVNTKLAKVSAVNKVFGELFNSQSICWIQLAFGIALNQSWFIKINVDFSRIWTWRFMRHQRFFSAPFINTSISSGCNNVVLSLPSFAYSVRPKWILAPASPRRYALLCFMKLALYVVSLAGSTNTLPVMSVKLVHVLMAELGTYNGSHYVSSWVLEWWNIWYYMCISAVLKHNTVHCMYGYMNSWHTHPTVLLENTVLAFGYFPQGLSIHMSNHAFLQPVWDVFDRPMDL